MPGPPKYLIIAVEDNSVVAKKLAPNSVKTSKIEDGAVTEPKLADGIISLGKLSAAALAALLNLGESGQIAGLSALTPLDGTELVLVEDQNTGNVKNSVTTQQIADLGSGGGPGPGLSSNNTWTGTNDFQAGIKTDAIKRKVTRVVGSVTSYTVLPVDHIVVIEVAASTTLLTVNLPAATGTGREIVIKRNVGDASTTMLVKADGAELIDGSNTSIYPAATSAPSATFIDDIAGEWIII